MKKAFFSTLCVLSLLLASCVAMQGVKSFSSLPAVEVSPPAKFTKGAPAYTMLFHTTGSPGSSSFPTSVGGMMAGAMGKLAGGGDKRIVTLRAVSHPGPADGVSPRAYHMLPPGMNMGEYLPLIAPERQPTTAATDTSPVGGKPESERYTIKIYWGCGENVRQGQPRTIDVSNMKAGSMPAIMGGMGAMGTRADGRGASGGGLQSGWAEALWPNKEDSREVPSSASLVGGHFLHGNFLPHMRFSMDARHDIMEKFALTAENDSLKDAIPLTWKSIPTAIGYHLTAFAISSSRKEIVIWTSSENPNVEVAGQFLDTPVVKKHIAAKVIMPADRTRCIIPRGIFDGMDMVMVSGTAWGDDYWASEPPRPANPPKNWKPDWVVKGQFLSTTSLMLGMPGVSGNSGDSNASGNSGGTSSSGISDLLRVLF